MTTVRSSYQTLFRMILPTTYQTVEHFQQHLKLHSDEVGKQDTESGRVTTHEDTSSEICVTF